jgi:aspartate aminotransferase
MVQKAAIAALTGSQECVAEMRADYIRLRDTIVAGLRNIPGITCTMPEGAFYAYPNVSGLLKQSGIATPADLTTRLLHDAGVVVVPGEAFGTQEHIRLSYAVSHKDVEQGLTRLRNFVQKL